MNERSIAKELIEKHAAIRKVKVPMDERLWDTASFEDLRTLLRLTMLHFCQNHIVDYPDVQPDHVVIANE